MGERAPKGDNDERGNSEPEAGDTTTSSAAQQAEERERAMEESGQENAA
jgi:hypothetical protein